MPLSRKNPRVQAARRLARSASARAEAGAFLLEGPKPISEAVAHGARLREAFVSPALDTRPTGRSVRAQLARAGVPLFEVDDRTLADLAEVESANGIVAVAEIPPGAAESLLDADGDLLLASGVQDPGNAGALARIAAAAGFSGLVADRATADLFSPKAVRGSAGCVLRLPVDRVADLPAYARRLASGGVPVLAATPRGGGDPFAPRDRARVAIVVGAEGRGLPPEVEAACTGRLTIPMAPGVESLNVSAAAAVLAFALRAGRSALRASSGTPRTPR